MYYYPYFIEVEIEVLIVKAIYSHYMSSIARTEISKCLIPKHF